MAEKVTVVKPRSDCVFEVTCVFGTNHLVYRKTFESYGAANRYIRKCLKDTSSNRRYELRSVSRLEVFYNLQSTSSRSAKRLIEDVFTRDWNGNLRPSKTGGEKL